MMKAESQSKVTPAGTYSPAPRTKIPIESLREPLRKLFKGINRVAVFARIIEQAGDGKWLDAEEAIEYIAPLLVAAVEDLHRCFDAVEPKELQPLFIGPEEERAAEAEDAKLRAEAAQAVS